VIKKPQFWKSILITTLVPAIFSSTLLTPLGAAQAQAAALTKEALDNATYPVPEILNGTVQLKDGKLDDQANRINAMRVPPQATGDLNRDGKPDAAVHLVVNTGGSGVFSYLSAVLNDNGVAMPVDSIGLGDRIDVREIVIGRNAEIQVRLLERRFDQAMAERPTIPVTRRFRLNADNKLVAVGPLTNADLNFAVYPIDIVKGGQATFTNGKFENKDNQEFGEVLRVPRAVGDIDGDGSPDTAVTLFVNTGGTANFVYVCAVLNKGYVATPSYCQVIDDRIRVTGISIKDGTVTVNYLGRRDGQPMSARPTVRKTTSFTLPTPAAQPEAPSAPTEPAQGNRVMYVCAEGAPMMVIFGDKTANVTYGANIIVDLPQQESGSGFRYANDAVELIGKGEDATLNDVKTGGAIYKDCKAQPAAAPTTTDPQPVPVELSGTLTGTVSYRQRIALLADALVVVQLQDVSKADAPAVIVSQQDIQTEGKQVPISFELSYDPSTIDPDATYIVVARIFEAGKLSWLNAETYFVLTNAHPTTAVNILVNRTRAVTTGPEPVQPPAPMQPVTTTAAFACDNGVKVIVDFDNANKTAKVTVQGDTTETRILTQQESGSGIRYADDTWELRSAGPGLVLVKSGTDEVIVGGCVEQVQAVSPATAPATAPASEAMTGTTTITPTTAVTLPANMPPDTGVALSGVLTGQVTYLQRVLLEPGALIEVRLEDVSKADAPAELITSQTIQTLGKQVPIPFELKYDPSVIDPRVTYALGVKITVDGKLRWINTTRISVLTRDAPTTDVEVVVDPV
jgi:uncharacterized lipoprotein YbaY